MRMHGVCLRRLKRELEIQKRDLDADELKRASSESVEGDKLKRAEIGMVAQCENSNQSNGMFLFF